MNLSKNFILIFELPKILNYLEESNFNEELIKIVNGTNFYLDVDSNLNKTQIFLEVYDYKNFLKLFDYFKSNKTLKCQVDIYNNDFHNEKNYNSKKWDELGKLLTKNNYLIWQNYKEINVSISKIDIPKLIELIDSYIHKKK